MATIALNKDGIIYTIKAERVEMLGSAVLLYSTPEKTLEYLKLSVKLHLDFSMLETKGIIKLPLELLHKIEWDE